MHFARVIGTVVCTEKVPAWRGQRLLLIQPTDSAGKASNARAIAAVDTVSAAPGQLVFYVRGREAATALANPDNPADAAILGLVDSVHESPVEKA
ncbi:MAG: EutN/CcmL family microcompartment protein [Candidatus Eisenbacteria bacterium]